MRLEQYQPWPVRMDRPKAVSITKWGRLWPLASTKAYRRMNQRSNQNCTRYPSDHLVLCHEVPRAFDSEALQLALRNAIASRPYDQSMTQRMPIKICWKRWCRQIHRGPRRWDRWPVSTPMRVKSPWLSEGLLTKECLSILCKCSRQRFFYEKFPLPSPRHNDWVHQGI